MQLERRESAVVRRPINVHRGCLPHSIVEVRDAHCGGLGPPGWGGRFSVFLYNDTDAAAIVGPVGVRASVAFAVDLAVHFVPLP